MSNSLQDVVVVGAGIVGAAIAHELSRYELAVTLIGVGPVVDRIGMKEQRHHAADRSHRMINSGVGRRFV